MCTPSIAYDQIKTFSSGDFQYHYPVELRNQAEKVAHITEEVSQTLMDKYGLDLPKPISVQVSNALYSNGQANSVLNSMRLWVTDWDIRLRTTHPWLADVTTHEFAHLATIGLTPKINSHVYGFQAIYQGFFNDPIQPRFQWLLPFGFHTAWLAEGISQYESSQYRFDSWDTHRDMIMRVATLNDQVLNFAKMDHFDSPKAIELETGPYTQGFHLVRFIAERFGDSALVQVWQNHGTWQTWSLDQALEDAIGMDGDSLNTLWRTHLDSIYDHQKSLLGDLKQGEKLSYSSFNNHFIRANSDTLFWLSNLSSPQWKEQLVHTPTDSLRADSTHWSELDLQPKSFDKAWMSRGWDRDSLGRTYITSYRNRDSLDRARLDIVMVDSAQSYTLTLGEDAFFPIISPSQDLYYLRRPPAGTSFELVQGPKWNDSLLAIAQQFEKDSHSDQSLFQHPKARERFYAKLPSRVLFNQAIYESQTQVQSSQFNIYSFEVNTLGDIALSFYDGYHRQLALLKPKGDLYDLQILKVSGTDLRDPTWKNDSTLVFSWNQNGVFNLYQYSFKEATWSPLTHVLGGAFNPKFSKGDLYYSAYDLDGFSLYRLPQESLNSQPLKTLPSILKLKEHPKDIGTEQRDFEGKESDYNPMSLNWVATPMVLLEQRSNDGINLSSTRELTTKWGANVQWLDPLLLHSIQMTFLTEVDQGLPLLNPEVQSDFFLRYDNQMTRLPMFTQVSSRNIQVNSTFFSEDGVLQESEAGISLNEWRVGAGKSIMHKGDTLSAYGFIQGGRQELAGVPSWWFVKSQALGIEFGERGSVRNGPQLTPGFQYKIQNEYKVTELQDSVYLKSQFEMGVDYDVWHTNETNLEALWVSPLPEFTFLDEWIIALKGRLGHLERISTTAFVDTTDAWLQPALWIDGYPFLAEAQGDNLTQEVFLRGDNVVLWEAQLQHPLWESEFSYRGFQHRGAWLSWIFQAGQAWDGSLFKERIWREFDYKRSLGLEFRSSQKIFHSMPLEFYFRMSRAMDTQSNISGIENRVTALQFVPSSIRPTTLFYGITFQFLNPILYQQAHEGH